MPPHAQSIPTTFQFGMHDYPDHCDVIKMHTDLKHIPSSSAPSASQFNPETDNKPTCHGRYHILQKLQVGSTAEVYAAQDVYTGDTVALKLMTLADPQDAFELADHESTMHQLVDGHANIVRLHGMSILSPYKIAIAVEYVAGGDLFELCRRAGRALTLSVFFSYAKQISSALLHLHQQSYAHCDIKPENILVSSCRNIVKLSDFGSARHVYQAKCRRTQGTPAFLSPALVANRKLRDMRACDVWACGITFFNMLTGFLPWERAHPSDPDFVYHLHGQRSPAKSHLWASIPSDVCTVIDHMLCIDINKRWPISHVYAELERIQKGLPCSSHPPKISLSDTKLFCASNAAYSPFGARAF